jgi:hypothetical protein
MKTKITAPALVLAVALAATVVAANLSGSARTMPSPVQGDPIPGIDVSIEQSPGGIIATRKTDSHGKAKFCDIAPGNYVIRTKAPSQRSSNNYNVAKCNCVIAGATIVNGSLDFRTGHPGRATILVPGTGLQSIEFFAKEGLPAKKSTDNPKPNPRN